VAVRDCSQKAFAAREAMWVTVQSGCFRRNKKEVAHGSRRLLRRAITGMPRETMKTAVIFSIPMPTVKRFAWRWRSSDHTQDSTLSFVLYADCATDAERNGYKVAMARMESSADLASGFNAKYA
jgi:hypothetical protein